MSRIITILRLGIPYDVLVDDLDYKPLASIRWSISGHGYARTSSGIYMHRLIMDTPQCMATDHINGNRLDNRRSNLRVCTHKQNSMNTGRHKDNKSGAVGVYWNSSTRRWIAVIQLSGKSTYIGSFRSIEDAIVARDKVAVAARGSYARLNNHEKSKVCDDPMTLIAGYRAKIKPSSGYRGVYPARNKWRVRYDARGIRVNIGPFDDPLDAAYVYDQIVLQIAGDQVNLNVL